MLAFKFLEVLWFICLRALMPLLAFASGNKSPEWIQGAGPRHQVLVDSAFKNQFLTPMDEKSIIIRSAAGQAHCQNRFVSGRARRRFMRCWRNANFQDFAEACAVFLLQAPWRITMGRPQHQNSWQCCLRCMFRLPQGEKCQGPHIWAGMDKLVFTAQGPADDRELNKGLC